MDIIDDPLVEEKVEFMDVLTLLKVVEDPDILTYTVKRELLGDKPFLVKIEGLYENPVPFFAGSAEEALAWAKKQARTECSALLESTLAWITLQGNNARPYKLDKELISRLAAFNARELEKFAPRNPAQEQGGTAT